MNATEQWIFLREMMAQHIEDELTDKKKKTYESKTKKNKRKGTDTI